MNKHPRKLGWLPLSLFWIIALFGGFAHAGPNDPPLRIGVSVGLTGAYENMGRNQRRAYQLWEKHVNEQGGILGRQVVMVMRDDRSDPETAKKIYEQFIKDDKVDFVFGPYSSPITLAIAPIVDKHGYPTLVAGASSDALWNQGYQNLFGIYSPAGRYAIGFLSLLPDKNIERIAIVSSNDGFSTEASAGMKKWAPQYGLRVTSFKIGPKDKIDMVSAAKEARDSGAQALLVAGHFNESVDMRKALKQIGWTPAAYYATVGPAQLKYGDILGDDANGTFSTSIWEPREDLGLPGSPTFLMEFAKTFGDMPPYQAATAYAAGQILEQAIVKAGTVDRAAVRDILFKIDANSIIGRYAVDRTGLQIKRFPLLIQWQGGKLEIVWPQDMKTASPIIKDGPKP